MAKAIISARIDAADIRLLDEAAAFLGKKRSEIVEEIIRQFVRRTTEEDWMMALPKRRRGGGSDV
jgi:uncharacterized protein (DUF1778 family)